MAKRIKLIYNPFSGDRTFKTHLDDIITVFQSAGWELFIFRSMERGDIDEHISRIPVGFFDAVAVSGGDGTVNIVLNALLKNNFNIPIGIIPSGTANDFASFLKLPKDPIEAVRLIATGTTANIDIGLAGGRYFLNECSAGLLTNISHQVDDNMKSSIGKLAYYFKGIEQITDFKPITMRITNSESVFEEDFYLFIALNSSGTGGFERLSKDASVTDGKFDFIAIRACPFVELAVLFVKIFTNDLINDHRVLYFRDNYIKVELTQNDCISEQTDVDGEPGPLLPLEIKNLHKYVKLFVPHDFNG